MAKKVKTMGKAKSILKSCILIKALFYITKSRLRVPRLREGILPKTCFQTSVSGKTP